MVAAMYFVHCYFLFVFLFCLFCIVYLFVVHLLCLFHICQSQYYVIRAIGNTDIFLPRDLDFVQYLHTEEATIQHQHPVDSAAPDFLSYHTCFCISTPCERSRCSV